MEISSYSVIFSTATRKAEVLNRFFRISSYRKDQGNP